MVQRILQVGMVDLLPFAAVPNWLSMRLGKIECGPGIDAKGFSGARGLEDRATA